MSKHIAVVTTGGTIGSVLQSESVSVEQSGKLIEQEIKKAKDRLGYDISVINALNKNSEDFTPSDWLSILAAINSANESDADGIVVTHGTDTLVYTVAAALSFNNLWKKKICFTGSYYSPDNPSTDATLNLLSALEFVVSHENNNGIYVAFRDDENNREARILYGECIKPMSFDDLCFESAYGDYVSKFSPDNGLIDEGTRALESVPNLGVSKLPNINAIEMAQDNIAIVMLYPGIDKKTLCSFAKGKKILIIHLYHSGTGASSEKQSQLMQFISESSPETKVMMGTFPRRNIDVPYESTVNMKSSGAHIYANLQPHFLYAFALLGIACGLAVEEIISKLHSWEI